MKPFSHPARVLLPVLLGGCLNGEPHPAHLENADESSIQQLESALSNMLDGREVTIATSAFSDSQTLFLESDAALDTGRSLDAPLHFRLWTHHGNCLLERVETAEFHRLEGIDCRPAPR